jgi:uncharacterized protein (TIGR00730 family)
MMNRLCVYCGSNFGSEPSYREAAQELARLLAARGIGIVYGGGDVGLMGAVADAAMAAGGAVTGVIPQALMDREVGHRGLTELHVVGSMHERKMKMADLSDAFVALPGGIGTLEEIIEVFTWSQLGLHAKPCALLNTGGYWDPLVGALDRMVEAGFLRPAHRHLLVVASEPEELLGALAAWEPPTVHKWLDREEA